MLELTGVHHVSALTNDLALNHAFYTRVLGMRLVKRTVNQDDPRMYHLFYADALGTPGTDMTFFHMPLAARARPGRRSISRTTFRVGGEASLRYWAERLDAHDVARHEIAERAGRAVLDFEDPSGLRASLVDDGGVGVAYPWRESPVPAEHQVRGLGYSVLTVAELQPTATFLTNLLNLVPDRTYPDPDAQQHTVHVYRMPGADQHGGGPAGEIHVAVRPDLPRARYGSGGVHHVALRVPDDRQFREWVQRLERTGLEFSGAVDRYYFRSAYVREPGGILFELATDGPGFTVDEGPADLGERLALPPFLEPRRADIEAHLIPLRP